MNSNIGTREIATDMPIFGLFGTGATAAPPAEPTASPALMPMISSSMAKKNGPKDPYNEVVQISAGAEDTTLTFTIHKDILRRKSAFFANEIKKHPNQMSFEFPDEDPEAFRRVKLWLYDGDIMGKEDYDAISSQGADGEDAAAEPEMMTPERTAADIVHMEASSATLAGEPLSEVGQVGLTKVGEQDEHDSQYAGGDELEEIYATAPDQVVGLKRERTSSILESRKKRHYSDDDVVNDSDDGSQASHDERSAPGSDVDNASDADSEHGTLSCPLDTLTLTKICALAERFQISELRKGTLRLLAERLSSDMVTPLEALMYTFKRTPSSKARDSNLLALLIDFVVLVCGGQEVAEYHRHQEAIPADLFMALFTAMVPRRVPRSKNSLRELWALEYEAVI